MNFRIDKNTHKGLHIHETKRKVLFKFVFVLLLFILYFVFMSYKYGAGNGFLVTALTWSFFVLGTPVADAGFLIDFPIRIITHFKMLFSEILVWIVAIGLNFYSFIYRPEIYSSTKILEIFKKILSEPYPFWAIFLISAIGTFISIQFGDELLDKFKHNQCEKYIKHNSKLKFIIMIFILIISFFAYKFLLKGLGLTILG